MSRSLTKEPRSLTQARLSGRELFALPHTLPPRPALHLLHSSPLLCDAKPNNKDSNDYSKTGRALRRHVSRPGLTAVFSAFSEEAEMLRHLPQIT